MTKPPWDDPDVQAWLEDARANLIPLIADADATGSLVPSTIDDVKFAVELGLSIMMDKPIIAIVVENRPVPKKLAVVADEILRLNTQDLRNGVAQRKVGEAIERLVGD